jgi:hypothetical protein
MDEMHAAPHNFLLQLSRFSLPFKVSDPEEIRMACVLTATGLIESESWPRLSMTERFRPVKYAWVERITDEGLAEIASIQLQIINAKALGNRGQHSRPASIECGW